MFNGNSLKISFLISSLNTLQNKLIEYNFKQKQS